MIEHKEAILLAFSLFFALEAVNHDTRKARPALLAMAASVYLYLGLAT